MQITHDQLKSAGWIFITQHEVMNNHLNGSSILFGGIMLQWLDEAAAMLTMDVAAHEHVVTVALTGVVFKNPGKSGTRVQLFGKVKHFGRSSVTILMRAIAYEAGLRHMVEMTTCEFTFVCIDDFGRPFPRFEVFPDLKKKWLPEEDA